MGKYDNVRLSSNPNAENTSFGVNAKDHAPDASGATVVHRQNRGAIGMVSRIMPRHETNAIVNQAIEAFSNIPDVKRDLASFFESGDAAFLPLDGEQEDTEISAVLFCYRVGSDVAVVNIGLAATVTDSLGELYINDKDNDDGYGRRHQNNIIVPRTAGDIYIESEEYTNRIIDIVSSHAGYSNAKIHLAGQMVIQPNVDITDPSALRPILFRAIDAAEGYMVDIGVQEQAERFNLIDYGDVGGQLTVRIQMGGGDVKDELGNLRRSDVSVAIVDRKVVQRRGERSMKTNHVTVASGWIDVCLTGYDTDRDLGSVWTEDNTQVLSPTFVMTNLDTSRGGVTLAHLMASLASVNILAQKNRWVAAFRPEFAHQHKYRFVGNLGRFVPEAGTRISRDGANELIGRLAPEANFQYVKFCKDAFYLNDLAIALDVEEAGPISGAHGIILDASLGNQDAEEACVDAADEAFNGCFRKVWEDHGRPQLFVTNMTHVPLGTFVDENGELREVRNIDLPFISYIDSDDETVDDFVDGMYDGEVDQYRRVSDVIRIIRGISPSFNLTGYAKRVFVTDAFFEVAAEAVKLGKISIKPDTDFNIDEYRTRGVRAQRNRGTRGRTEIFDAPGGRSRTARRFEPRGSRTRR